ncbi:hypothetical protein F5Y16DRAFT_414799 [Xylariaceae sp. FL0255]|nr:hypothetical protein F5Y16DRAFT_414799 [Xylariaceae sp. FL0255]
MDLTEKFFQELPKPDPAQIRLDENASWDRERIKEAISSLMTTSSSDAQKETLIKWTKPFLNRADAGLIRNEDSPSEHDNRSESPADIDHAFLPIDLVDTNTCDCCGSTGAKMACSGCLTMIDSHFIFKTAYCNQTCQRKAWAEHKAKCRGRRAIWHATSVIHDLTLMFQKRTWVDSQFVFRAFEENGVTVLKESPLFREFPAGMFGTEEQAPAGLMGGNSSQVLSTNEDLIALFWLPICETLEFVEHIPRNAKHVVCHREFSDTVNSNMFRTRSVLRATLKSGEQFAVDISAAEFGWREFVAPWAAWAKHRMVDRESHASKRFYLRIPLPQNQINFSLPYIQVVDLKRKELAYEMGQTIRAKMRQLGTPTANALCQLNRGPFNTRKSEIIATAEAAVQGMMHKLQEDRFGLMYQEVRNGDWLATQNKHQAEALDGVWMTNEEYAHEPPMFVGQLDEIYSSRWNHPDNQQKLQAAGVLDTHVLFGENGSVIAETLRRQSSIFDDAEKHLEVATQIADSRTSL